MGLCIGRCARRSGRPTPMSALGQNRKSSRWAFIREAWKPGGTPAVVFRAKLLLVGHTRVRTCKDDHIHGRRL